MARLRSGSGAGRQEGQALVEFALVLPLLAMLLVGIIYAGITFYDYVTLADAVAVGARTLATNRATSNPCTLAENAVSSAGASLKQTITIATPTFTTSGASTPCSTCSALCPGDAGTVSATYPCYLKIPFAGINLCPVVNSNGSFISSQTTVRIE